MLESMVTATPRQGFQFPARRLTVHPASAHLSKCLEFAGFIAIACHDQIIGLKPGYLERVDDPSFPCEKTPEHAGACSSCQRHRCEKM